MNTQEERLKRSEDVRLEPKEQFDPRHREHLVNKIQGESLNYQGACREDAKNMLQNIARKLNKRQRDIEILLAMLPSEMTREQDEALWNLINSREV